VQELRVVGVRVELPGNQPILLLKETQGERYLPIWIGAVEAAAIAFEQQGVRPARPMTHDLLREVVSALGATLEAVNITEMRDGIYIAELVFGDERVVSARPSDAVALAVRTGAPIFGADELLDEVGIEIPDEQEDEVEKFREFLDQISPEDFGAGSGSGGPAAPPDPGACLRATRDHRQRADCSPLEMMRAATRRPAQLTAHLPRLTVGEQQRCDT
jgi:bifunctional DNase/RNase